MRVDLFSIGKFTVHTYGLMIAIGIIIALVVGMKRADKKGLKGDEVFNMTIIAVIIGFLGAKLFFVLENLKDFIEAPLEVLGSSGFVVYGGLIIGVLGVTIYCKHKKYSALRYADIILPSVAIAQGFGRLGCFFAGCCYGKPTDAWWGVTFPEGSFAPAGVSLIPTQLLSFAGDIIIALVLMKISDTKYGQKPGRTSACYLLLYGIGRFSIEFLRENTQGGIGCFTTAQLISFAFIAAFVVLTFIVNHLPETTSDSTSENSETNVTE